MPECRASAPGVSGTNGRQYLTFSLADREYGVEIASVQEIKGYTSLTPIPHTPPYVKGVMNLRGTIVPVIDFRMRLGMESVAYTAFSVIVVVAVGPKVAGAIVDAVSDVLHIADEAIQPPPEFVPASDPRCVAGIAQAGEGLVVLIDVETLLNHTDIVWRDDEANLGRK